MDENANVLDANQNLPAEKEIEREAMSKMFLTRRFVPAARVERKLLQDLH